MPLLLDSGLLAGSVLITDVLSKLFINQIMPENNIFIDRIEAMVIEPILNALLYDYFYFNIFQPKYPVGNKRTRMENYLIGGAGGLIAKLLEPPLFSMITGGGFYKM